MTSQKLLKILNPIMALDLLIAIKAVLIYKYSFIEAWRGSEMVYEIHEIAGMIFFVLAIFHIILNWNWIRSQIFGIKPKQTGKKK